MSGWNAMKCMKVTLLRHHMAGKILQNAITGADRQTIVMPKQCMHRFSKNLAQSRVIPVWRFLVSHFSSFWNSSNSWFARQRFLLTKSNNEQTKTNNQQPTNSKQQQPQQPQQQQQQQQQQATTANENKKKQTN